MRFNSFSRREFTQWMVSLASLLAVPKGFAQSHEHGILLRTGDPFSDPAILRRRLRAGLPLPNDLPGNALRWRLIQDQHAGAAALAALRTYDPGKPGTRTWPRYAEMVMAADWLLDHKDFSAVDRTDVADRLMKVAAVELNLPELRVPSEVSYHNYTARFLGLAIFALAGVQRLGAQHTGLAPLQEKAHAALRNVLSITQFVIPDGGCHESMDYMRIALMPMVMLAELQRTLTGVDPAQQFTLFRNIGPSYVYKLLPDGTPSREGDNEYPILDERDAAALCYAVHRFHDKQAAWLLQQCEFMQTGVGVPILKFLWANPDVSPVAPYDALHLPHARHFRGIDQVVMRSGFRPEDTRIEFDCGPYFAKHQHLDRGHFTIHHRGHLAIDSGADYYDAESPHYINYYRRTIAHNTMLVYDPKEKFFWSEDVIEVANDGGQRMDSSRFWNTIRSCQDWENTRDIWDLGHIAALNIAEPRYHYVKGDATHAYSRTKMAKYTRELVYLPQDDVLVVFDDVRTTRAELRKTWLLHTVEEPAFVPNESNPGEYGAIDAKEGVHGVRIAHQQGETTLYPLLPRNRFLRKRGGKGYECWTPGNATGGVWGTGRNWPVDPAEGGPLPKNPEEVKLWKTFWGQDFDHILTSNRRNVVPGEWRIEVEPKTEATDDFFLNVFVISDRSKSSSLPIEAVHSTSVEGARCGKHLVLFTTAEPGQSIEFTMPDAQCDWIWLRGLPPSRQLTLSFTGSNFDEHKYSPGMLVHNVTLRTNSKGITSYSGELPPATRARIRE